MKPMKDPLGVSFSKGNQGTTRGKEKFLLTSVGIEPTTSGLDLLSWASHSTLNSVPPIDFVPTSCVALARTLAHINRYHHLDHYPSNLKTSSSTNAAKYGTTSLIQFRI